MKIEYVKIDENHGVITVDVEEKDYADNVKKQLKEIGKKHAEPGFRPGHVPAGLIAKKYGNAVKYDEVNKLVGNAVYDYIRENEINVLGNPVPDKENVLNPEEKDFKLKFNVGVAPDFDVKLDKDVHIPYYRINVTDEMVDTQDKALRRRMGTQGPGEEVDETSLVKGVMTELNEDGTDREGCVVVENGIVSPQYFRNDDQRKLFAGKHVGDAVVFNPWATADGNPAELSSMLNIDKDEVEAHKGDFRMDIKEIIVLKPAELGEEYYNKAFGEGKVADEKSYREEVRKMIEAGLEGDQNYRFTIDAEKVLTDNTGDLSLPDDVLKDFLLSQNEKLTPAQLEEEYPSIRKQLVWDLVKDNVARKLAIEVSEDDLMNTALSLARNQFAQYGMTNVPEDAVERFAKDILKDEKSRPQIARQTSDMKLFNGIRASVTPDVKEVSVEEFNQLFAPAAE